MRAGPLLLGLLLLPGLASAQAPVSTLTLPETDELIGVMVEAPPPADVASGVVRVLVNGAGRSGLRATMNEVEPDRLGFLTAPTLREVSGHNGTLETTGGVAFARFYCHSLEVIEEAPQRVRVRWRYPSAHVVLVGWLPRPLAERGTGDCPPRVVSAPRTHGAHTPTIPQHYVVPDPAAAGRRLRGLVWLIRQGGCQSWRFRHRDSELVLRRVWRERTDGNGLYEHIDEIPFEGGNPPQRSYGPVHRGRWIREPRGVGMGFGSGAIGGVWDFTIVRYTAERIEWLEASGVIAYHPADVGVWYRTRAACVRALP